MYILAVLMAVLIASNSLIIYADETLPDEQIEVFEDFIFESDSEESIESDSISESFESLEDPDSIINVSSDNISYSDDVAGSRYVVDRSESEVLDDSEDREVFSLSADDLRTVLEDITIKVESVVPESEDLDAEIASDYSDMKLLFNNRNASGNQEYNNTVVFSGVFDGTNCRLVVPRSSYDYLTVIDGKLVNVGSSSVVGRLLYNDSDIDLSDYETYSYTLSPVSSSPTNVYRYGSYNYRRHYYLSSGSYPSITSTDMYGDFYVSDVDVRYSSAHRLDYIALIMILLGGVSVLWTRRHSLH